MRGNSSVVEIPGRGGFGIRMGGDLHGSAALDLVKFADAEGVPSVWVTDEPFFRGAVPMAAGFAASTQSIRIGLGVVNPFDHPPVWMAMEFAAVNEIASGRAILGIGACWEPPIAKQGMEFDRPLSAVVESIEIQRRLFAGESVHFTGKKFQIRGAQLDFTPQFPEPHIYMASMFPRSLEEAGRIADGVIISVLCPVPYVERALERIRHGAGGKLPLTYDVVQYIPMCVSEDGQQARRAIREKLAFYLLHSYGSDPGHWARVAELGKFDLDLFASLHGRLEAGESPQSVIPDDFVDMFSVAGTPSQCLDVLERYKAAGTTEPVMAFPPGVDMYEQVGLVANRLLPGWRAL